MTTVDENRLRGNYAQALVMSWLSRSCLVRPVAEGTDIGVDLYCESVVEKTLYLHFWVQVKAVPADSVKFRHGKAKATYPFETKHLNYWGRQPVPVYALLVPLGDWPPEVPDFICGVRVTNEIVRRGVPEDQVTKSYSTSDGFASENIDSELQHFFTKVVPVDTAALLQPRGIIAPLPDVPGDPDRQFVADVGIQHLPKALETMVGTAEASLMECVIAEGKERFVVHRQPEPSEDGTDAIPDAYRVPASAIPIDEIDERTDSAAARGLAGIVRDAKLITLGEPVHAAHEPLMFRNRLIEHLAEVGSVSAIALETGLSPSRPS